MSKRVICAIVTLAFVLSLFAACAKATPTATPTPTPTPSPTATPTATPTPTPSPTAEKVYKLKFFMLPTFDIFPYITPWLDEIEQRSGGRIKIERFQEGEHPYKAADLTGVVRDRIADMSYLSAKYIAAVEPIGELVELPFLLQGVSEIRALMTDPDFSDIRKAVYDDILDKWNLKSLFYITTEGYMIAFDDHLLNWDSLEGRKIRVHTKGTADMISILGGTPVTVSFGEVYSALQRGIIDGLVTSTSATYRAKLFEVVKHVTVTDHMVGFKFFPINKDSFAELPSDLQAIVLEVSAEVQERAGDFAITDDALCTMASMREYGTIVRVMHPDFREEVRSAMRPSWDDWAKLAGPPAAEVLQRLEEFHAQYIKAK